MAVIKSLIFLVLLGTLPIHASEVSVFSVNKNLSMGPKDAVFRDYYLNGGSEDGFRRGMLVTVVRRVPVHDLSRNRALGDLRVPVAKLKLIYVNRAISVGRVEKIIQPTNLPATEFTSVMIGDTVSLGDGIEDLGRMDDLEGDGPNGEAPKPGSEDTTAAGNVDSNTDAKSKVASVQEESKEAPKPELVTTLPEKNAEKTDTQTKQAVSEPKKKNTAKAPVDGKKQLKTPRKPDNSSTHDVVGPTG